MRYQFAIIALIVLLALGCRSEIDYSPKPRSFPKLEFPERTYTAFNGDYCDFSFEYPGYAKVEKDPSFFDGKTKNDCWFDVVIPQFDARIHCSYYPIDTDTSYEKLLTDAFELVQKHTVKADYIDEYPLRRPDGTTGFIFDIDGPAASPFQFFLTDSTEHFLRGSLYIKAQSRPDSLKPVISFLKEDVMHLVNTLEWE